MKIFAILVLIFSGLASAETLTGRVVSVADGDTITILTSANEQVKIRLAQIDAPEKKQPWGERSKQSLSDLVFNKDVVIEADTKDRYGRTVGQVLLDEVDINLEQIKRGMAWVYEKYAKDGGYFREERRARANKVGLWSDSLAIAPWVWRQESKQTQVTTVNLLPKTKGTHAQFDCESVGRRCGEMRSCAEAEFALNECGITRLDGDHDGMPCESLCR